MPDVKKRPEVFICDGEYLKPLEKTAAGKEGDNWYVHYQLGLLYYAGEEYDRAEKAFLRSEECCENAWAYHGLASVYTVQKKSDAVGCAVRRGVLMNLEDVSYIKECFHILQINEKYAEIKELYEILGHKFRIDGRIRMYYTWALAETGHEKEAFEILQSGLNIDDLREGEKTPGELWKILSRKLYGTEKEVPSMYDFTATEQYRTGMRTCREEK